MKFFDVTQAVQFAVTVEENGEKICRAALDMTDDKAKKTQFGSLADEEAGHRKTFEDLRSVVHKGIPEEYPGEYYKYVGDHLDEIVLNQSLLYGLQPVLSNETAGDRLAEVADLPALMRIAVRHKSNSILYYHEVRRFVDAPHRQIIDKIIDEEREHFLKLVKL
jgi:rubrerythrin